MRNIRILLIFALSMLVAACQKDGVDNEGFKAQTLTLTFAAASNSEVQVDTRAVEEATESDVTTLYAFVFQNGELKVQGDIVDLTEVARGDYMRRYTGKLDAQAAGISGTVKIYAIANYATDMWSNLTALKSAAALGEDELKKQLFTVTSDFLEPFGTSITLVGWAGTDGTATIASDGSIATQINLKRPYAKVAFNFKNGKSTVEFTPTSYELHNLPLKSALFEDGTVSDAKYFDVLNQNFGTQTPNSLGFYQLENIQSAQNSVARYHDRDKKSEDGSFVNAPLYGTYVRVYGDYVERDADGSLVYSGDVNYTIHLGNFGGGDYNAYSINRNTSYTYNVTVNGVDQIIVEAKAEEDGDFQHGAEGYIIDASKSSMIYTLDSHYETVLIRIDPTSLSSDGSGLILSVNTPYMTAENANKMVDWDEISSTDEAAFLSKYDIEWVEFLPNSGTGFSAYPGTSSTSLLNAYELLKEIYNYANGEQSKLTKNADGYIYLTCFINEYYYDKNPLTGGAAALSEFVNANDRTMKLLQSPSVSPDGNSIYATVLCSFDQKAIATPFDLEKDINSYGVETYDETGAIAKYSSSEPGADASDDNDILQGRTNFKTETSGLGKTWSAFVGNGGYDYKGQSGNVYSKMTTVYAKDACMQRNRDNNGNGTIDEDEIRWYTAAAEQLGMFWLGESALPTQSRLYTGLTTSVESYTAYNELSHIYTSSGGNNRIFWAIEGANYGGYTTGSIYSSSNPKGWQGSSHTVRCLRNLKTVNADVADAYSFSDRTFTAENLNSSAVRASGSMVGEYGSHNERDNQNMLPYSFKVASKNATMQLAAPSVQSVECVGNTYEAPAVSSASCTRSGSSWSYKYTFTFTITGATDVKRYYYKTSTSASAATDVSPGTSFTTGAISNSTIYVYAEYEDGTVSNYTIIAYSNGSARVTTGATLSNISAVTISFASVDNSLTYHYSTSSSGTKTELTVSGKTATITPSSLSSLYIWAYDGSNYSNATTVSYSNGSYGTPAIGAVKSLSTLTLLEATTLNVCATYSEETDGSDAGLWRVPNEREFVLMYLNLSTLGMSSGYYHTRTLFSNRVNASNSDSSEDPQRYGFSKQDNLSLVGSNKTGYVRCVRDVQAAGGTSYDGSYTDGGNLTK